MGGTSSLFGQRTLSSTDSSVLISTALRSGEVSSPMSVVRSPAMGVNTSPDVAEPSCPALPRRTFLAPRISAKRRNSSRASWSATPSLQEGERGLSGPSPDVCQWPQTKARSLPSCSVAPQNRRYRRAARIISELPGQSASNASAIMSIHLKHRLLYAVNTALNTACVGWHASCQTDCVLDARVDSEPRAVFKSSMRPSRTFIVWSLQCSESQAFSKSLA
mmetsp:Transcript_60164/g.116021  ORF Transcript_60164/g.116021 Transcript_60164/m.116021 type:complete len:220 (+) Transcript_60164:312-971(+)